MKKAICFVMALLLLIGTAVAEGNNALVKQIKPVENKIILAPGATWQAEITFEPENATNKAVEWKSSNEKVATVDENGLITGHQKGACRIDVSALDGSKRKAAFQVQVKEYDVVILKPVITDTYFDTTDDYAEYEVGFNGRVKRTTFDRKVTFKGDVVESAGDHKLRPLKAGEGTVEVISKENNRVKERVKASVYVAQNAISGEEIPDTQDFANGKNVTGDSELAGYWRKYATDGEIETYWESEGYPADLTIYLGKTIMVTSIVIRLNPDKIWAKRTQTIEVYTSLDGKKYEKAVDEAIYRYDPKKGNRISIAMDPTETMYVKLRFLAGEWKNAQAAEIMVNGYRK